MAGLEGNLEMDEVVQDLSECGRFQVLWVTLLFLAEIPAACSMLLMSFGNYNPGWRCLDGNDTTLANDTTWYYSEQECAVFESCQRVQFHPEADTVVSEWGLLCDRTWIASTILSAQMAGIVVGSYLTGFLGDVIGRKRTFSIDVFLVIVFNIVSYFSTSWYVFAVMRFFIGMTYNCMVAFPFILASEFTTARWRSFLASLPTFGCGSILFAVMVMLTKDYRLMQLVTGVLTAAVFLPTVWAPESLRWLAVKKKKSRSFALIQNIARTNRKPVPSLEHLDALWEECCSRKSSEQRKYSWRHLWQGVAFKRTLIFTPVWFVLALLYYVIAFGIKALTGDFYTNLMVSNVIEFPVFITATFAPNLLGRKKASLAHSLVITACLFVVIALDRMLSADSKGLPIMVLVMVIKFTASSEWYVLVTYMAELYPTVIRTTSLGYGGVVTRLAGVAAPYLIPSDPDTHFISYSVMAFLTFACSVLLLLLPETQGEQLKDTWDSEEEKQPVKDRADGQVMTVVEPPASKLLN